MTDSASFAGRRILLGVSGSIALYKVADWLRSLVREDAAVTVVMTEAATRFVSPLTFAALSGRPVHTSMFAAQGAETIPHINLAKGADIVLLAPATAQTVARLAHGLADDLLATVVLAARVPVVICPAMNSNMFLHPATTANLDILAGYGYRIVAPDCGAMACGDCGPGRLPEWTTVRDELLTALSPGDLAGRKVLVTAGPTREFADPVRFLSNPSTGRMGYALARAARIRGAEVTLISGPVDLEPPAGVTTIAVVSALDMHREVMARAGGQDIIIKNAAVSDFRFAAVAERKMKKREISPDCRLLANPDILAELGEMRRLGGLTAVLVGFAAESGMLLAEGERKLQAKNLDLLAVNDILADDAGFAADTNRVTLLGRDGSQEHLPLLSKEETAHRILGRAAALLR
ncbi:MAG: bifunctional phosphopantothenoylcysteine decarboxylase/phosphopantothenate--cysteine ligase CoaBC [Thermodesulfobacteriota bacterium]